MRVSLVLDARPLHLSTAELPSGQSKKEKQNQIQSDQAPIFIYVLKEVGGDTSGSLRFAKVNHPAVLCSDFP